MVPILLTFTTPIDTTEKVLLNALLSILGSAPSGIFRNVIYFLPTLLEHKTLVSKDSFRSSDVSVSFSYSLDRLREPDCLPV